MARICFIRLGATPLFVPDSTEAFGGAEVRALTFSQGLARRGRHQVSFAVQHDNRLPRNSPDGIEVVPMPGRTRGVAKWMGSVRRRLLGGPLPYPFMDRLSTDIVACFGVHWPTPSVIESARRARIKSILFLTLDEDVSSAVGLNAKERRRHQLRRFALLHADQIVVQTEQQRQALRERFGRDGHLIRNPIDTRIAVEFLGQDRRHVLWVGRADYDTKRADVCFSLARQCPGIPFRVVMNGGSTDVLRQLLEAKPKNVTLIRHVPLAEIEELFASASVLINTSVKEGFPNAFLQAAKHETPILSLGIDPDGMLSKRGCGEVADGEGRMIQLISEYHRGGSSVRAIGRAAREYVVSQHDLTQQVMKLEDVLENLSRDARQH